MATGESELTKSFITVIAKKRKVSSGLRFKQKRRDL